MPLSDRVEVENKLAHDLDCEFFKRVWQPALGAEVDAPDHGASHGGHPNKNARAAGIRTGIISDRALCIAFGRLLVKP
jgi:hypothetical protein